MEIETITLRRSIERDDVEWRGKLVAAHYVLDHTPQFDESDPGVLNEDWALAHQAFHAELLSACGSRRLLRIAEDLRDSAELYRRWSSPLGGENRDIAGEHRALLDAVQSGDVELALERLSAHISHTTDVLLKHAI